MKKDWEDGSEHQPHTEWDHEKQGIYTGSVEALRELEEEMPATSWGPEHFEPVEFEIKHAVWHLNTTSFSSAKLTVSTDTPMAASLSLS